MCLFNLVLYPYLYICISHQDQQIETSIHVEVSEVTIALAQEEFPEMDNICVILIMYCDINMELDVTNLLNIV
jgi:hypothetical protein